MTRGIARTTAAVVAAGALAVGAAACGDDEEPSAQRPAQTPTPRAGVGGVGGPEAPTQITGGTTTLQLDAGTVRVLDAAGVEITPLPDARRRDGDLVFPIVTGDLDIDTLSGRLQHDGGLRFSVAGGRAVEATGLLLDPRRELITARIAGERVPLLSLDLGRPRVIETSDTIVLPGSGATVGEGVVDALNEQLGVNVFTDGLRVGEVTVRAKRP